MGVRAAPRLPDLAADPDDRLIERPAGRAIRWNTVLVGFMRIMAAVWLVKGLLAWTTILGIGGGAVPFDLRNPGFQAVIVYFAVIDLVAAVGLWLTSTWGGVLWLLAIISHMILAAFFPRLVSNGAVIIGLFIAAIMIYLTASWLAAVDDA